MECASRVMDNYKTIINEKAGKDMLHINWSKDNVVYNTIKGIVVKCLLDHDLIPLEELATQYYMIRHRTSAPYANGSKMAACIFDMR